MVVGLDRLRKMGRGSYTLDQIKCDDFCEDSLLVRLTNLMSVIPNHLWRVLLGLCHILGHMHFLLFCLVV
jgi:hypothetical protein